jgi:hypothetical protein
LIWWDVQVQREEVSRFTYGELSEKLAGYGFQKIGEPALVKSSPKAAVDQVSTSDEYDIELEDSILNSIVY